MLSFEVERLLPLSYDTLEVSLSKTLNPKLLPMGRLVPLHGVRRCVQVIVNGYM